MIAYKYRAESELPFALDIIHNKRLFCANWNDMNDPMEGLFFYDYRRWGTPSRPPLDHDVMEDLADFISSRKRKKRICSLSLTPSSKLLWAHYGSGYSGIVLEVNLPDCEEVNHVEYDGPSTVDLEFAEDTDAAVNQILSRKFQEWHYEEEVRIIQEDQWFKLDHEVSRVICGQRMNSATYKTMQVLCESKGIPISRMYVEANGNIDLTGEQDPMMQLYRAYQRKQAQPIGGTNE